MYDSCSACAAWWLKKAPYLDIDLWPPGLHTPVESWGMSEPQGHKKGRRWLAPLFRDGQMNPSKNPIAFFLGSSKIDWVDWVDHRSQDVSYCGWLRNPNHQLIDGKHPIIHRVEKPILLVVQDFATHSIIISTWWFHIASYQIKYHHHISYWFHSLSTILPSGKLT